MWAITKREFWNLIKSVRALIIILLFSAGSIWVTNSLSKVSGQLDVEEYYASLRLLVLQQSYPTVALTAKWKQRQSACF